MKVALVVNQVFPDVDANFATIGGSMAVSGEGEMIASFPLGKVGMLLADL